MLRSLFSSFFVVVLALLISLSVSAQQPSPAPGTPATDSPSLKAQADEVQALKAQIGDLQKRLKDQASEPLTKYREWYYSKLSAG
jgi:hypothetical protein